MSDKIDLLGFNALLRPMTHGHHGDIIVALGFIQNECPTRDVLDYEKNFGCILPSDF